MTRRQRPPVRRRPRVAGPVAPVVTIIEPSDAAKVVALRLAAGDRRRLVDQPDGTVLVVNQPR